MSELETDGLPGLDLGRFRAWYDGERPGEVGGELSARLIAGGKSNLTYEVTDGTSWWIVRRPPLGHVQATAHDMGREYTAMTALAGTDVPVPRTFAHCADDSVLGSPFYVMERVEGIAYRQAAQLDALGAERTSAISTRLVEVLAALHAVDPDSVGLAEFGRPQGFLERQVRRWGKQLEGSRTREHPDADELHRLLAERVAAVEAGDASVLGIVHGDYRLDNCLVGADDEIHAVVDWEMATLGDTRTDLALMMVYDQLSASAGGDIVSDVAKAQGWPGNDQQLARYADATGREPGDMGFHLALAYFKLAVILEGIHYRFLKGQTVGEGFDRIGEGFDLIVAAGLDLSRRTDGLRARRPHRGAARAAARLHAHEDIEPAEPVFAYQLGAMDDPFAWSTAPVLQELRAEAKSRGLWNLFLPGDGQARWRGRPDQPPVRPARRDHRPRGHLAPPALNCSAPDTGNMEVLAMFGTGEQKERWLPPLLAGTIRSGVRDDRAGRGLLRRDQHRDVDRPGR